MYLPYATDGLLQVIHKNGVEKILYIIKLFHRINIIFYIPGDGGHILAQTVPMVFIITVDKEGDGGRPKNDKGKYHDKHDSAMHLLPDIDLHQRFQVIPAHPGPDHH